MWEHIVCVFILSSCIHTSLGLLCCQFGVSSCLSEKDYQRKSWMTKTRWGFSTNLYRGELMQCHYPFFFVLVFPTLCKEKLREEEGLLEKKPQQWQSHSHKQPPSQLHHYRKWTSLTFCALALWGLWMSCEFRAQKNSLFPIVADIWIMSVWRCELFAFIVNWSENTKILLVFKEKWQFLVNFKSTLRLTIFLLQKLII